MWKIFEIFHKYKNMEKNNSELILQLINEEKRCLYKQALQIADTYWEASHEMMKSPNKADHCYIGTRVRLVRSTIVCEWYKNIPYSKNAKKQRFASKYLKLNKTTKKYSMSNFTKEPLWARMLIERSEGYYAEIRREYSILCKCEKLIKNLILNRNSETR